MKKFFLILTLFFTQTLLAAPITTSSELNDASRAYGFYIGQNYALDQMEKRYPELKFEVKKMKLGFESKFGDAIRNIDRQLQEQLKNEWSKIKKSIQSQTAKELYSIHWTPEIAQQMLKTMAQRAEGNVESPILETLLSFKSSYQTNPSLEFRDGYRNLYETKGHPKAKGLEFSLEVPKTWKASEGKRPNIVQRFTENNGYGNVMFMILVNRLPEELGSYTVTEDDIKDLLSDKAELKEFMGINGELLGSGYIKLEGAPGFWIKYTASDMRGQNKIESESLAHVIFYQGKMLMLMGMVPKSFNGEKENYSFEKYELLFKQIVNSLILPGRYQ